MESLLSNLNASTSNCDESCYDSSQNLTCNHKNENTNASMGTRTVSKSRLSPGRPTRMGKYIAEIDEVRINPNITKKGYLNFLEEKSIGWVKKFVTIRRPLMFVYNNDRDPLERGVVNLSTSQIVYNEDQIETQHVNINQN